MDQSHLTKPGKVKFYTIFEIRRNFRRGEAYFTSSFTIDVVAVLVQSASNICIPSFTRMVSSVDIAKRMLVTLLKSLAGIYGVVLGLTRESTDTQVKAAYKQVSRRAHPDQGGEAKHQASLNAARDSWEDALRASKGRGSIGTANKNKGKTSTGLLPVHVERHASPGFRVQGVGVLLTYQKFSDTGCWQTFLDHVETRLVLWKVKYWCATMETNDDGAHHLHLMLQFHKAQERKAQTFVFLGVRPNARPNDLLGEGFCKKKLQQSLDRGFFYVWANKVGTVRGVCRATTTCSALTGSYI